MKRTLLGFTAAALLTGIASSASAAIFMSEYVEGGGDNKGIELYNTGTSLTFDANDTLLIYFNGNTSPSNTIVLAGTIGADSTFVIADNGAAFAGTADQTDNGNFFNGDDAIELYIDGVLVDSFGQVGLDPGSQWAGGGQDDTLRRKSTITSGDTNSGDAFDASVEWDSFAKDTFDGLGSHTVVPEPSSLALLGLGGLLIARRRRA